VGTGGVVTLLALIVLAGVPAGMGLVELLIWMLGGRP
jgi:hypothetical protein